MVHEGDEWWCNGVEPGAIAGGGISPMLGFEAFRDRFQLLLQDFARESSSFDEFERNVRAFFSDSDEEEEKVWREAIQRIKDGAPIEDFFAGLATVPETRAEVIVQELKRFMPAEEFIAMPLAAMPLAAA